MVVVIVFLHFLLGEQYLDASFALAPETIGLPEFGVVEVDLPDEQEADCAQVERFGVD